MLFSIVNLCMPLLMRLTSEMSLFTSGAVVPACGRFTLAFSYSLPTMMCGQVMVATGGALLNTLGTAFMSKNAPPGSLGVLLGLSESVNGLAGVVAPVFGGMLFEYAGSSAPACTAGLLSVCAFFITRTLNEAPESDAKKKN